MDDSRSASRGQQLAARSAFCSAWRLSLDRDLRWIRRGVDDRRCTSSSTAGAGAAGGVKGDLDRAHDRIVAAAAERDPVGQVRLAVFFFPLHVAVQGISDGKSACSTTVAATPCRLSKPRSPHQAGGHLPAQPRPCPSESPCRWSLTVDRQLHVEQGDRAMFCVFSGLAIDRALASWQAHGGVKPCPCPHPSPGPSAVRNSQDAVAIEIVEAGGRRRPLVDVRPVLLRRESCPEQLGVKVRVSRPE